MNTWYIKNTEDGISVVKLDDEQTRKEQEERETRERHKRLDLYFLAICGLSILLVLFILKDNITL